MSTNEISHAAVIPTIESSIFDGHESSHLAVGIVAVGSYILPGLENEYTGYSLLRGNVYAHEKMYMPVANLNSDGTETDPDDARSVHFAVIENSQNSKRVVGAMRLIVKSPESPELLPIEEHYPISFEDEPAPVFSTEVSRLICRHENPKVQSKLKWLPFAAGVSYITANKLGPVFGAVEESLEQGLQTAGVPVTALGSAIFVEEFNANKLPIRVDIPGLTRRIEDDNMDLISSMKELTSKFVYTGVARTDELDAQIAA